MKPVYRLFLFIALAQFSCNTSAEPAEGAIDAARNTFKKEDILIKVAEVRKGDFYQEIISNGKVYAVNNAEIKFSLNEQIERIYVKNGSRVQQGQVLALLDDTQLRNKLNRSKEALQKSIVELDDRLIDYGYRLKDSARVPADIMRMAKIKSGYNSARYDYYDALSSLSKTLVRAPFSGTIANLEGRAYNSAEVFRKLCNLIDDSQMQVEFNVLETEYRSISKGSPIDVIPYGEATVLRGIVTEINPMIDENGMIKISAMVSNRNASLINGMSVKVQVKKRIADRLFIPKEAVVQRQDREVVFTYENGLAKWNYVETELQNTRYVSIRSGLNAGQKVIVSNNFNLAHDTQVKLDNDKPEDE